jgi:hypothetical protein
MLYTVPVYLFKYYLTRYFIIQKELMVFFKNLRATFNLYAHTFHKTCTGKPKFIQDEVSKCRQVQGCGLRNVWNISTPTLAPVLI